MLSTVTGKANVGAMVGLRDHLNSLRGPLIVKLAHFPHGNDNDPVIVYGRRIELTGGGYAWLESSVELLVNPCWVCQNGSLSVGPDYHRKMISISDGYAGRRPTLFAFFIGDKFVFSHEIQSHKMYPEFWIDRPSLGFNWKP
jgi:hypothetical protein